MAQVAPFRAISIFYGVLILFSLSACRQESCTRSLSLYHHVTHLFLPRAKANRTFLRFGQRHEPADNLKDLFELGIVFLFHGIELTGKLGVGRQHLP